MRRRTILRSAAVAATTGVAGYAGASRNRGERTNFEGQQTDQATTTEDGEFTLSTDEWENGESIPTRFTCEGENVSPRFSISNPPEDTEAFALVMDDPDAPNPPFVHWLVWNIPADAGEIPESVPTSETVGALGDAVQGANGTGELGYVGPCPPEGDPQHTYLFSLYALESSLDLGPGAEYRQVVNAVMRNAIGRSRYVGQYERDARTTTTESEETTTGAESGETVDVAVGPDGKYLQFVPEEVEISVGDTVRWTAESEGHNVSFKPEAHSKVELPEGVEPFATYEGNRSFMVMEVGETFEHTFTVPGTYGYVCVPHAGQGMVGRVIVSE
ncbi:YbhB/YbcL family Raf kinase inhibitor-like protein [Halorussus lipolyticus]|uniref:YbhB/YbcL family Raf kinase inhibitor-like protein n=1 Tax=Halorussus lipolyticus TaxID=3034024 RepID=UPI0023E8EC14|nr:YbhB/YbcL family Raf kinase inhibitor-like protein [Halorussus sp. DT80]